MEVEVQDWTGSVALLLLPSVQIDVGNRQGATCLSWFFDLVVIPAVDDNDNGAEAAADIGDIDDSVPDDEVSVIKSADCRSVRNAVRVDGDDKDAGVECVVSDDDMDAVASSRSLGSWRRWEWCSCIEV